MREHNFSIPEWSDCCMIWWRDLHRRLKYSMDNMQPIISWGRFSSQKVQNELQQYKSWQEPTVLGWSEHVSIAMAASYLCNLETIVFNFYCLRFTDWRMKAESRLGLRPGRKTTINYVKQRTDHFCRIGCWWKETRDFSRSDIELGRYLILICLRDCCFGWFWFQISHANWCWIEQF